VLRLFPALMALALLCSFSPPVARAEEGGDRPAPSPAAPADRQIRIVFGGDVTLSRHVALVVGQDGPEAPLEAVPELARADLAIVNLESVLATSGERNPEVDGVAPHYFRGRPELLGVLRAAGVDVVTTANTHTADYGTEALLEQGEHLDRMGILAPGSGANPTDACAPVYAEAGGLVVAILAFDTTQPAAGARPGRPGTCHVPLEPAAAMGVLGPLLEESRRQAHVVLVGAHWGADFERDPSEAKRELGRLLVEAGADAVLGSHAHLLQGIETHLGRPILHDAGNLLLHFDGAEEAGIFELTVGADGVHRVEFVPLVVETGRTRRPTPSEADALHATLERQSANLGTDVRDGSVVLGPERRNEPEEARSVAPVEPGPVPAPLEQPPADCVVDAVPRDAAITPIETGPLTLVGVRSRTPDAHWPGFIHVESFWTIQEPVDRPLLLMGRAGRGGAGSPGWAEEQEPCDWAWPVTRWEVGTVYRDVMLLRPSDGNLTPVGAVRKLAGVDSPAPIRLGVGDVDGAAAIGPIVDRASYGLPWLVAGSLIAAAAAIGIVLWKMRRRRAVRTGRIG
jgi:hypothetical protein